MDRIIPTKKEAQKWANALRSGKYKQTQENLQDKHGYCCLGVGCSLFIPYEKQVRNEEGFLKDCMPYEGNNSPKWLCDADFHIHDKIGVFLTTMNDSHSYTFDEIADIIELVYVHKAI